MIHKEVGRLCILWCVAAAAVVRVMIYFLFSFRLFRVSHLGTLQCLLWPWSADLGITGNSWWWGSTQQAQLSWPHSFCAGLPEGLPQSGPCPGGCSCEWMFCVCWEVVQLWYYSMLLDLTLWFNTQGETRMSVILRLYFMQFNNNS